MYPSVCHLELIMYKRKYTPLKQFRHFQLSSCQHHLSNDVSKGTAEKRTGFVFNKRLNRTEKTEQSTFVCRESVTACFGYFDCEILCE